MDIGCIKYDDSFFHNASLSHLVDFLVDVEFVCGHNILNHDAKYIKNQLDEAGISSDNIIDTLYLSPLLFPTHPYHALLKDDKLQTDETNNPLNDAIKAKNLFLDEVMAFGKMNEALRHIIYLLLKDKKEFAAFFKYQSFTMPDIDLANVIKTLFDGKICNNIDLDKIITNHPIELAYSLTYIYSIEEYQKEHSVIPYWVLKNYPDVDQITLRLRNKPCLEGCKYCTSKFDIFKALKNIFGFDNFRSYDEKPLQEMAVRAAVESKSMLAVFPTGGGKSLTFQLPALMSGKSVNGLTVIISPLQSLMKDQVDNLEKVDITDSVTINGMLDPIERAKSFERVADGSASILYISPESLRSRSIERLILGRKVVRFVIDEAHCFSAWGQDFRVDYLYIGDFIKSIQEKKNLSEPIPVSCFTATAKQNVINDIITYFKDKLDLDLELYTSSASRTNLRYKVYEKDDEEDKYQSTRDLIESKNCPTIIYVSRTRKAYTLAERLTNDGIEALPYHGKMDSTQKRENQNAFISGDVSVIVATSAFGMGVDKKDVGMVIHYEISDSLENYIQEAGRAGRDENIWADCYVLFNEEDLSKHFILLNQTRLSIKEIQQVWRAIKDITKFRSTVSNSALEIARLAGWDDSVVEIETRVTSAIAALEEAGYLKRGQNMPRVFANSILSKTAQEAIDKINYSDRFDEKQKQKATRIIKKLFSSKKRKEAQDEYPESRVDYISDHLGIVKEEVIDIINLLREENILADAKDLTAFIKRGEKVNRSLKLVQEYGKIENFLIQYFEEEEKIFHLKELNELAESNGCNDININKLKAIINFWAIKNWIKRKTSTSTKHYISVASQFSKELLSEKLFKRHELSLFIAEYLYDKSNKISSVQDDIIPEVLVEFSVLELKNEFARQLRIDNLEIDINDVEDALFYLSRINSIKIEGGFLVSYNKLTIERIEQDNRRRYRIDDYQKLAQFYENKVQQIHIVGEYARRMIDDYKDALQFVEDYFKLNYSSFLNKYFKGARQNDIKLNITPNKFRQLFGELSPTQLKIIRDNESIYIVVAAGPGSGKTRVLVHKLASLLLMEDVKHEQLLMLTFSRSAVTEFKKRLLQLVGNAAHFIEIKTFHSYCFDLLGKVGSLDKSNNIIQAALQGIIQGDVERSRITKSVLVIDEAQDMDPHEFELVRTLMHQNEEMRVIAVGDDDQNIFEFRGADSKLLEKLMNFDKTTTYELIENYRSKQNLVDYSNVFVKTINHRLKTTPIISHQSDDGSIKVVKYKSNNIIEPMVRDIISLGLSGTTCIMTPTNDEALQVAGLLLRYGLKAKLIQSNDGFRLHNLSEVRYFLSLLLLDDHNYIISNDVWQHSKRELQNRYISSDKLSICINLIENFESTNPKVKYKSDFEVFINESKLEDFIGSNGDTILVSTIHKAKGREFDNVFLMLDDYRVNTDETRRSIYVAMTRAKTNLSIHLNSSLVDNISANQLEVVVDNNSYSAPSQIAMHLTHKDVWLGYFRSKQYQISKLFAGDELLIANNECLNRRRQSVLKFSKQFEERIDILKSKGYILKHAKVNFILYWKPEDEEEIKIVLPELIFTKTETD